MTILRPTDNPHELLDIRCDICRERLIATREEAHAAGWGYSAGGGYYNWDYGGDFEYAEGCWVHQYDLYFCPECFIDPEED